jgi:hypothetical protein
VHACILGLHAAESGDAHEFAKTLREVGDSGVLMVAYISTFFPVAFGPLLLEDAGQYQV